MADFIYFVRHGANSQETGHLTGLGKDQIRRAGLVLAEDTRGRTKKLISSPSLRATESAEMIVTTCDIDGFEPNELLFSDAPPSPEKQELCTAFIKAKADEAEVLIVVTHHEIAHYVGQLFALRYLGTRQFWSPLNRGGILKIDVVAKTAQPMSF